MSDLSPLLKTLAKSHITHKDIQPLINTCSAMKGLKVKEVGQSFEQRSISLISMGHGPMVIFAWTQMHGNEATATAAVFDLIDLLLDDTNKSNSKLPESLKNSWESKFTLHILPMLNPDGAERCIRQNAQGIDINRDAQTQQSPEGRLLMQLVDELKPDIGFNLHDQSPYYQCGISGNPATIAFLAPAFDYDKTIDSARLRAMQIIVHMNKELQKSIPDCIARYDDTYSPRSFGDNIAGKQVSTILIESGAAINDPDRQIARQQNVEAILSAMDWLTKASTIEESDRDLTRQQSLNDYFSIPENISEALSSLLLRDLDFGKQSNRTYTAGVSIKQTARYSEHFFIDYVGDLGIQAGLKEVDCKGLKFNRGSCYEVNSSVKLLQEDYKKLLKQGYVCFYSEHQEHKDTFINNSEWPMLWLDTPDMQIHDEAALRLKDPAYFLIEKDGEIVAAVLNGRFITLSE